MSDSSQNAGPTRKPLPKWKKSLLVLSVAAFVAGGSLHAFSYFKHRNDPPAKQLSSDPSKAGAKSAFGVENSLVDGGTRPTGTGDSGSSSIDSADSSSATDSLAPFFMNGGLSFFVGFCMGYAIRTFFKITAFAIGTAALLFFALSYFHVIPTMDLSGWEDKFHSLMASLTHQFGNFRAFVEGHLPSSTAATAGIFTGWKKN